MTAVARILQMPLPGAELDELDLLASRSRRLADIVSATSRRKDVRRFRAKLLLLLLDLRCPLEPKSLRQSWYVPGAVARLGAEGLRRAWSGYFGEPPRCLRTFRAHLGVLQQNLALIRSPGDWLYQLRSVRHPERRPRHADTFHVLETDQAARWWQEEGAALLESERGVRHNPDAWRRVFGSWRVKARHAQRSLFDQGPSVAAAAGVGTPQQSVSPAGGPSPLVERPATDTDSVELLTMAAAEAVDVLGMIRALGRAGAVLRGPMLWRLARDPKRLSGAVALLAVAISRGDRIRSRAGWVVRAFKYAKHEELRQARALARRHSMGIFAE